MGQDRSRQSPSVFTLNSPSMYRAKIHCIIREFDKLTIFDPLMAVSWQMLIDLLLDAI